jgi:Holliday junction resolvase
MNHKAKGTNAERELVKLFNEAGWSCVRIAGSGCSKYPSPDLLAGNAIRRLAIECKTIAETKKYFSAEDLEQLRTFAKKFGAESWIGIKFSGEPWYFLMLEDLEKTATQWVISLELAKRRGLSIEELMETKLIGSI